jgi:hypothetical protein
MFQKLTINSINSIKTKKKNLEHIEMHTESVCISICSKIRNQIFQDSFDNKNWMSAEWLANLHFNIF